MMAVFAAVIVVCVTLPSVWTTSENGDGIPCIVEDFLYKNGDLTGDACNRCRCRDGIQACTRNACYIEGEPFPTPRQDYICQYRSD